MNYNHFWLRSYSTIVGGKTAQGISNDLGEDVFPKGKKFTLKMLNAVDDYAHLISGKWTTDNCNK